MWLSAAQSSSPMPSREQNKLHFNEEYDWSDGGEFWTPPDPLWKQTILDHTLRKYLRSESSILEIGPGAGRWTAELLRFRPRRLVLVDLAPKCLELCRQRFAAHDCLEYYPTDGRSLDAVADASIDFLWSFDVFVHIEREDIEAYFDHIRRVLVPGAVGVVHYASIDRAQGENPRAGWRADFSSAQMFEILGRQRLTLLADHFHPQLAAGNSSIAVFQR
jgi:ubiquinone/menaquinone biosynthesis C-methylase UbiE